MNIIQDRATNKFCKPILGIGILTKKELSSSKEFIRLRHLTIEPHYINLPLKYLGGLKREDFQEFILKLCVQ